MPRIPQYTNDQNIDPSMMAYAARAAEYSGQQQSEALGQSFRAGQKALSAFEQHAVQSETSKLAADFATAHAELTAQWNETAQKADPNDHEVASRFLTQVVQPRLESINAGLLTSQAQEMYQKASAGLKADFFTKTTADQAALAGNAAVMNLDTVKNRLSQAARNDPSSFQSSITMANLTTEGLVQAYGLPRDKAMVLGQSVREEIARSAFIGMADSNPQEAMKALDRGEFSEYFDGSTAKQMQQYAEHQMKAMEADRRSEEIEARRQSSDAFHTAASQLSGLLVDPNTGEGTVPAGFFKEVRKLSQMPGADDGTIRALNSAALSIQRQRAAGQNAFSDPDTYDNFKERMFLPSSDPNALTDREIYQARADGTLGTKDMSFFLRARKGINTDPERREAEKQFNFFLNTQKGAFTTRNILGGTDPKGMQNYYAFSTAARQQFEKAYASGHWQDVLQPNNPAFLGKLAPTYLSNRKGAGPSSDLFGTVMNGYRFTGHSAAEWKDKSKWQKVGQ